MRRYPVRSGALRAIGYDFAISTLEIELASGGACASAGTSRSTSVGTTRRGVLPVPVLRVP